MTLTRRILRATAFLLLGALLTITTAWCCLGMAILRSQWSVFTLDLQNRPQWLWTPPHDWDAPNEVWVSSAFGGLDICVYRHGAMRTSGPPSDLSQRAQLAGWPLLALQTREEHPSRRPWKPITFTHDVSINSWEQGLSFSGVGVILPLLPRWPGFAVNTLFYAAILWSIVAGLTHLRRRRRRTRGRCITCGYALAALTRCPECGNEARPRAPR